jgi:hypothetical protein
MCESLLMNVRNRRDDLAKKLEDPPCLQSVQPIEPPEEVAVTGVFNQHGHSADHSFGPQQFYYVGVAEGTVHRDLLRLPVSVTKEDGLMNLEDAGLGVLHQENPTGPTAFEFPVDFEICDLNIHRLQV